LLVYTYGITDYDSRGDDDNGGNDNQHGCGDDDHDRCRNDDDGSRNNYHSRGDDNGDRDN